MITYYILDPEEAFNDDKLIKLKPEGLSEKIKSLAQSAARRQNSEEVAVILFHTSCCSVNKMRECMTYLTKILPND